MSTLITIAVKIILAILALERFFRYIMDSNMMTMMLFIIECQRAGRRQRKKEKENGSKGGSGNIS
jgi:hypothetical protein